MNCLKCNSLFEAKNYNQLFCCAKCRSIFRKKEEGERVKQSRRVKIQDLECLPNEYWVNLIENEYFISNLGRLYSAAYRKLFKIRIDKYGYPIVALKKIAQYPLLVHRLVAQTFVPNPENKPQVNHKNGIKLDSRVENLEWLTAQENITHSVVNGLKGTTLGHKRYNIEQPLRRKAVEETDKKGHVIREFESQTEASLKTGINHVYISRCCLGKQSYAFKRYFRFKKIE